MEMLSSPLEMLQKCEMKSEILNFFAGFYSSRNTKLVVHLQNVCKSVVVILSEETT